ncbi:MAG: ribosome-binding factor A [Spirochaetes bacterium GWD1_61_31]|nr:MAG: ribosome-binding factor A [Spirochaetes bacterium GWB1_60_80]OHD35128.1 MAG: ribosome-binding factor A [Spirochaetes bacterium GWC1_61_12]OHD43647.1 MAG: ribosome-binding factor A [Spirochaetes bacterium GWD1_61_31]OHD44138.1 MAG: ribosome-binding factor A [Spirochaetes bacterium GWE1_60_18]OHD61850.1 MAG: ribosome-binding factor A [Spirochaetes bacterium GWF1_60_12]HAW85084.1 30S ribosome-binding factor RbfA [Spirochaetaceae bacterium]
MEGIRLKRVEEQVRTEVAALLLRGDIKDPRVDSFLSITRVALARDGSHAKVFVSTFKDEASLAAAVAGLNHAAGFIQANLAKRIHIRLTPRLVFVVDTGIKQGFEMGEKLKDLLS